MSLPRYGLAAIVKDETAVLRAGLESLRPLIGYWVIADTGSTDGTQELVREVLGDIPGELLERPWVDFGHNRSEVFAAIRGKCDWYFAHDADMVWEVDPGFEPDPAVEAYLIQMGDRSLSWRLPLLHRGDLPWVSIGACHEYSALEGDRPFLRRPTDAVRVTMPAHLSRKSEEKSRWYLSLLLADHERRPDDERVVYFIGQAYAALGDRPQARAWYARRAGMGGSPEEVYYAAFQAAMLADDWPTRAAEFMAAWEVRPSRWEALNALCRELNHRGLHQVAYRLTEGEFPVSDDVSFVHPWVSEWGMTLERSIAAYWTGRVDECRVLSERLLARDDIPEDVRTAVTWNLLACTEEAA